MTFFALQIIEGATYYVRSGPSIVKRRKSKRMISEVARTLPVNMDLQHMKFAGREKYGAGRESNLEIIEKNELANVFVLTNLKEMGFER